MAVTLQRYTTQEVILQDYRIPPKVNPGLRDEMGNRVLPHPLLLHAGL